MGLVEKVNLYHIGTVIQMIRFQKGMREQPDHSSEFFNSCYILLEFLVPRNKRVYVCGRKKMWLWGKMNEAMKYELKMLYSNDIGHHMMKRVWNLSKSIGDALMG